MDKCNTMQPAAFQHVVIWAYGIY